MPFWTIDMNNIAERIAALRDRMREHNLDAYFVPTEDPHQSEYVPLCWQRRPWLTGFSGSAGFAVIGLDKAWLWADSRYYLQAEAELDEDLFILQRAGQPEVPNLGKFLSTTMAGKRVGVDARVVAVQKAKSMAKALQNNDGELVLAAANLIDDIWQDRPNLPASDVTVWSETHAGRSVTDKVQDVRDLLAAKHCDAHVITMLDAIAWLYNIRGQDVNFNPVNIAYALVTAKEAMLFLQPQKVGAEAQTHFDSSGITVKPYDEFAKTLATLQGKVWIDNTTASQWVADAVAASGAVLHQEESSITLAKAVKNDVELAGMRAAHERDGVAEIRFLHWLESAVRKGGMDEIKAADQLRTFREDGELFVGPSFETISGFAGNGAIVHYRVSESTNKAMDDSSLYLVDSGGQYFDGTTDITRTRHFGTPTAQQKEHYTLVLKGHIALRLAVFPVGTSGTQVDILARKPLWDRGLNFGHGTGHGVGCYLNVHEGPHRIAPGPNAVALRPGMIVSNEPGFYLADQYGIRVENLVEVVKRGDIQSDFGDWLGFEDLTLVPYCRELMDVSILSAQELQQVNAYHKRVYDTLQSRLPDDVREWLALQCATFEL